MLVSWHLYHGNWFPSLVCFLEASTPTPNTIKDLINLFLQYCQPQIPSSGQEQVMSALLQSLHDKTAVSTNALCGASEGSKGLMYRFEDNSQYSICGPTHHTIGEPIYSFHRVLQKYCWGIYTKHEP
jgi:hypothetical protein